jgi:hypothetical protein
MNETAIVGENPVLVLARGIRRGAEADADALVLKDGMACPGFPDGPSKAAPGCGALLRGRRGGSSARRRSLGQETREGEPDGSVPGRTGWERRSFRECAPPSHVPRKRRGCRHLRPPRIAPRHCRGQDLRTIELHRSGDALGVGRPARSELRRSAPRDDRKAAEEWLSVLETSCLCCGFSKWAQSGTRALRVSPEERGRR